VAIAFACGRKTITSSTGQTLMDVTTITNPESLVAEVISTWRAGVRPDTAAVLAKHPELRQCPGVILDLAYEEYCLRQEAGERLSLESFCDRFPSCRHSLGKLLAVHSLGDDDSILAASLTLEEIEWPELDRDFLGFYLLRELGRGAFARVYLARQPALGNRFVVVKVAQFGATEAEMMGRLAHRNIVPVHSVNEDPQTHMSAVCMPYLGSATLLDILDVGFAADRPPERAKLIQEVAWEESIPQAVPEMYLEPDPRLQRSSYVDGVVHLGAQLAEALQHTHQAGICHRDLKPSNVLLTPSGRPMLLDFNLSSDTQLEQTFVGGTLPYMAPEELRRQLSETPVQEADGDPRSDLFSLGVILYELLTGHLPFGDRPPDADPMQAARHLLATQKKGFRPIQAVHPHINTSLVRIVEQCLALEPDARPNSAEELVKALRAQLTRSSRLMRWGARRKVLLATATLAALLLTSLAVGGMVMRRSLLDLSYVEGQKAYAAGDYQRAVQCFSRACDGMPDAYEPLFARGQTLMALDKYDDGLGDLKAAYDLHPSGPTAAWLGYAYDCQKQDVLADQYYLEAISQFDFPSAAVWNNRGCLAFRHLSPTRTIEYLTNAIALEPARGSLYRVRALAHYRCASLPLYSEPHKALALEDIDTAVALSPPNRFIFTDAAVLHATLNQGPDVQQRVAQYITRALELGAELHQFPPHIAQVGQVEIKPPAQPPSPEVMKHNGYALLAPAVLFPALGGTE
jgi:tetratricopeptide (TPR) repeat protein